MVCVRGLRGARGRTQTQKRASASIANPSATVLTARRPGQHRREQFAAGAAATTISINV
jgi:hypothetical protein